MDIELMREFVVFSRYLNFSKAAGKLNLAQPTLSSHVASMEKELGFELVHRGKRLRLTPSGKRFCADAERLVADYNATIASCRDLASQKAGSITFERPIKQGGIDRDFDYLLLLFQERYPAIALHKQTSPDLSLRDILETGAADAAFVFNDTIELFGGEFAADAICLAAPNRERGMYYLWLDSSHPLAQQDEVRTDQLGRCKFLIPSSIRYQSLENLAQVGGGITNQNITCSYWPGSYEECILNIRPDETMIVNDDDLKNPAYALVANRVHVPLTGLEELIKPSFVYLKSNDNPALEIFAEFIRTIAKEGGGITE